MYCHEDIIAWQGTWGSIAAWLLNMKKLVKKYYWHYDDELWVDGGWNVDERKIKKLPLTKSRQNTGIMFIFCEHQ